MPNPVIGNRKNHQNTVYTENSEKMSSFGHPRSSGNEFTLVTLILVVCLVLLILCIALIYGPLI
ncbi:MAG: hypothetical protein ACW99U_14520 [Candidatus Thorarchaeota archaeon]